LTSSDSQSVSQPGRRAGGATSFYTTAAIQARTIGTDTREGVKGAAENFYDGTAAGAFRTAIDLIRGDYERMIDEWQR